MSMGFVQSVPVADTVASSRTDQRVLVADTGYVRRPPFHMDLDLALPPTTAALTEYLGVLHQQSAPIAMYTLPDALVSGQGSVVTRNAELLRESVLEFLAFSTVPDGFASAPAGFWLTAPITRTIESPCILAKRPWFANFGHWMVDAAALLALAAETCRSDQLTIVVGDVGGSDLRQVMQDTVSHVLPGATVLFHPNNETWCFRSLRYVTPVHVPPLFKLPLALSKLRDAILPDWPTIEPTDKLFLIRGLSPHLRALKNLQEIMEICVRRGYRPILPGTLPIAQAARLFAAAKAVIGVKGAALVNALFCKPDTVVMALSPADFPDPFFWDLVAQRGINYGEVFGAITTQRPQGQNDFVIEPTRLAGILDAADALTA